MKKPFYLLLALFFFVTACNPVAVKTVSELAALGIRVVTLINGCSDLSEKFSSKVTSVNAGMVEGIQNGNSVLELSRYWEKYWYDVEQDYNGLVSQLQETHQTSLIYFAELKSNNQKIVDPELKATDAEQTQKVFEQYNIEFEKAKKAVLDSKELLVKGNDIMLVLRNNVLRSSLEGQIETLKLITLQSKTLANNIQSFSESTLPLFTTLD